jgi:hypothetical protein
MNRNPMQTFADRRAEMHARSFSASQSPGRDMQVEALMAEGYNAQQIAMMLKKPPIDVRLAMAIGRKERENR